MVLATRLNHPFSARKGCATDNIATESYKAMSIWFVVAWDWLMTAHRVQKRLHCARAKTLQCTYHARIMTTNAHKAISSNHTTYHDAMDLHKWLIGVSGLYSDEDWPRRDLKTQNSKFHFRNRLLTLGPMTS